MSPVAIIGGAGLRTADDDDEESDSAVSRNLAQEISVLHSRVRSCIPPLHDTEHTDQGVHSTP